MKKGTFDLFIDKILAVPFWIKQVIYLKLSNEMKEMFCEDFLKNNQTDVFSTFVPTLTFKGRTEISERKCGLDNNIYNFLQGCLDNKSLIEISVNTFLSMEEVAKYYELCLEQSFIKTPDSIEIHAMAGFIAGKFRTGEYFKQKGKIDVDQLQKAILAYRDASQKGEQVKFGQILVRLGFIKEEDLSAVMRLKDESKKRFILDYNTIPRPEISYSSPTEEFEDEINKLKNENIKLKQKMMQLLEMVKRNA